MEINFNYFELMDINRVSVVLQEDVLILKRVFSYLDNEEDFIACHKVCRRWRGVLEDEDCWREIYFRKFLATPIPSASIPLLSQLGWKRYFQSKLRQRETFLLARAKERRKLGSYTFKLGTQTGHLFDYRHTRLGSGGLSCMLLGEYGIMEGRLVKGSFDRTLHYFNESEVGHVAKAIFYRNEGQVILGGPSGSVYLKSLETDAKIIARRLGDVVDLLLTDDHHRLFVISRLEGRDHKITIINMKNFEIIKDYEILNLISYRLVRDTLWYAKESDESEAECDFYVDNQFIYQGLKGRVYKIDPLHDSPFTMAYTSGLIYLFKDWEIIKVFRRKKSAKKVLLGVSFDIFQEPIIIYGKGSSESFVHTSNELSLVVSNGTLAIYDAMNGDLLYSKNIPRPPQHQQPNSFNLPPIKVLHSDLPALIVLLISRSLYFFGTDPQIFSTNAHLPPSKQSVGGASSSKKKVRQDLVGDMEDQLEEVEQGEREGEWLNVQRERMNIEGMSEEDMIQYAIVLSLDSTADDGQ